jgi:hypothetical protein
MPTHDACPSDFITPVIPGMKHKVGLATANMILRLTKQFMFPQLANKSPALLFPDVLYCVHKNLQLTI